MTEDRELSELEELARSAELMASPPPPEAIRRLGTQRRRRRTALGAAAAVALIAVGGGVALSQTGSTLGRAPDPAGPPTATPGPTPRATTDTDPGRSAPARTLTSTNLLKAGDLPVLAGQRAVVTPEEAGRPTAKISLCFPDRGIAGLGAREVRVRNFGYVGGAPGGPGGQPPAREPAAAPTSEPTQPAAPEAPTEEPTEPTPGPTQPTSGPTSPSTAPPEPTPEPTPTVAPPDNPTPKPGDGSTPDQGNGQVPDPGDVPTSNPGGPATPRPSVYTLALQFDDSAAAEEAYGEVLQWRAGCEDLLRERHRTPLGTGAALPWVAVEVRGRQVGQFTETTYRSDDDTSGSGWFESTGVTRVEDRMMITVSLAYGQDYNVSWEADGDEETGQPAHPQFGLITASAKRLGA